jgi:hypothetical protein
MKTGSGMLSISDAQDMSFTQPKFKVMGKEELGGKTLLNTFAYTGSL